MHFLCIIADWSADIIPDPSLGSGSPASNVSNLFSRHEFDKLNNEAGNSDQGPKNMKQAVDYVLHDVKPAQRTQ
jgi:cohesin loading factor subunit SCC2